MTHFQCHLGLQSNKFDISTPQKLVALASTMVRRKVARKWRRQRRQLPAGSSGAASLVQTLSSLSSAETDPARAAEFNDQLHAKGTLSMARLSEPDSASASFFIVTAKADALDGKYSAFGMVESGLDVVEKIEGVALNGETPIDRVELRKVTVVRK